MGNLGVYERKMLEASDVRPVRNDAVEGPCVSVSESHDRATAVPLSRGACIGRATQNSGISRIVEVV